MVLIHVAWPQPSWHLLNVTYLYLTKFHGHIFYVSSSSVPICAGFSSSLPAQKKVCFVRGGRLMISPVSHRRPEEINLSAHLGTSAPTSSCWLCHRSSRTPGMKNASRETLRLSRGLGENRLSEHVQCSDPEKICFRIKINKWPDFEVKKYLHFSVYMLLLLLLSNLCVSFLSQQQAQKMDYRRIWRHWIDH